MTKIVMIQERHNIMSKILLIDGNSILNRAFYGIPELTTADGRHTNAVLGFLNIVLKVIDEEHADHVCVAFDLKHPTFRHEMYKEYKGTRKPMPDELREQVPLIKQVLLSMNIHMIEKAGYEADDILGTLSRIADREGYEVTVLSGDRDLLQLATDRVLIRIPKTKAGKTVVESYHAKEVCETYGVDPVTFIDMKGLMGDTSDNIPGVPGIGEKTASKLLVTYGSMDGVYAAVDDMKKSKMRDNLIEYREQAYMSKVLATIKLDCELDDKLEDMKYENPFNEESYKIFADLEFKSLMGRFSDSDMKQPEYSVDYKIISDIDAFKVMSDALHNEKKIGSSCIAGNDGIVCWSVSAGAKSYLVRVGSEITENVINDLVSELNNKSITIICDDIKSELPYLSIDESYDVFDCGLAAYLINPLKDNYSYVDLARDYMHIDVPEYKELVGKQEITYFSFEIDNIAKYMAYKSSIPLAVVDMLVDKLSNMGMKDLYYNIELPCAFSLYDMEKNGIRVDRDELLSFGVKLKARIEELTSDIYKFAGKEFNINSTKQLGEVLFEDLGLKSGKKTKTGYSTSVEVLEKLQGEHPIIGAILEYRQLTKLNSTYVEGLSAYIGADNRIHGKFNQTVTVTGRISSTEPNLQNIPTRFPLGREIRKVFKPEKGYVFLDADYSQIELRVLAHFSEDETLINAYHKDTDIHSITASEVFDVPIDKVDSLMRRRAKAVNFGIVYGISSFGLGQDLDISRKEAEGYIEKYFNTYGGVKRFLDNTVENARKNGYTTTLFGRRRPLPELSSSNYMTRSFGERAAMNSPIQGTAADIIKIAMIHVNRALKDKNLKSRIVLQVHDELIIETYKPELDEVKDILVNEMMNAAKLAVPLVVDVHSGDSWYDAK